MPINIYKIKENMSLLYVWYMCIRNVSDKIMDTKCDKREGRTFL